MKRTKNMASVVEYARLARPSRTGDSSSGLICEDAEPKRFHELLGISSWNPAFGTQKKSPKSVRSTISDASLVL